MDIGDNYLLRGDRRSLRPDYYFQTSVQGLSLVGLPDNLPMVCMCARRIDTLWSSFTSMPSHNHYYNLQLASPGETVRVNVKAMDRYSHNTTAFLEIKVQLFAYNTKLSLDQSGYFLTTL